jgi:multidrug efflux pump subunit AcrA (membrane-fusion protein)
VAGEAPRVELTAEQQRRIGLGIEVASTGSVAVPIQLPGTILVDPDREAQVTPLAPGIVIAAPVGVGAQIEAGATLAVIDSATLAEAKLAYFAAATEVGCCVIKVPRAKEIFDNVNALIVLIQRGADQPQLARLDGREMGEWRARILSALAETRLAQSDAVRERALQQEKVSSQRELQAAEAAVVRGEAALAAVIDTARFEVLEAYSEACREQQVAELALVTATTQLRLLGVDDAGIAVLDVLVPKAQTMTPCQCTDPDCDEEATTPGVLDTLGDAHALGRYELRAPRSGTLVERRLAIGESVSDEVAVARIVDIGRVWMRINIYQRQLPFVRLGALATVSGEGLSDPVTGTIASLSPLVDEESRTVAALISLDNPEGRLRPGMFVTATIDGASRAAAVVVPNDAVQVMNEQEVVFVPDGDGFVVRPVRTGPRDARQTVIHEGLAAGDRVVVGGAFELKAKIVTSALGGHAGHGH